MDTLTKDVLYIILKKLNINDWVSCKKVCTHWNTSINKDTYFLQNILSSAKMLSNDFWSTTVKTQYVIHHKYSEYLLPIYMKIEPQLFKNDSIMSLALTYNKFNLVDMILLFKNSNNFGSWNAYMVDSATTNNIDLAKYCKAKGAKNFGECFYTAKKYDNEEIADYFISEMNLDKENITMLWNNKQYNKIYDLFDSK